MEPEAHRRDTDPDGIVTGSAVTEVRWSEVNSVGNYPSSYKGEATVVDLGPRGVLFALIGEETKYIALRTFSKDLGANYSTSERGFAAMAQLRGIREVPPEHYPLLVTFTDIDDPATVKRVDPDNLAAAFGSGVSLKRITLEITDEVVSEGRAGKVLGWLVSFYDKRLDGQRFGTIKAKNRFANSLSAGSFSTKP